MTLAPASLLWFARHEFGLNWRDWTALMTGGRRVRAVIAAVVIAVVACIGHLFAAAVILPNLATVTAGDTQALVGLTGAGLLFFTVMLSQALESVTRAYYARADLDLILSSPASARRVFTVRTLAIAVSTVALSCLLAGPALNVLAVADGPHWLFGYGVLIGLSALATAISIGITLALFRWVGAQRTRLVAQIIAAIVGAGFIIGIQVAAILAYGQLSRFSVLQSDALIALAPGPQSLIWLPARAAMGNAAAFGIVALVSAAVLGMVIYLSSASFARHAVAAAGVTESTALPGKARTAFRPTTQKHALRRKEWVLLLRDPWLLSQTLMQILYLVPPALLLWLNYGQAAGAFIVVAPVLVMASGQLAGGLAWLAISGEDAHDLVVTAPVSPRAVLGAKIEAVLGAIAVILAPLLVLLALSSPWAALVVAVGAALSASSATAIQLWFRSQARRAMFRRRQVSSRAATLCEAFASITWAGAAALAVTGSWIALVPAVFALMILGLAKALSPKEN